MNAAFMSLVRHERGIHALQFGTGGARVTGVRSRVRMLPVSQQNRPAFDAPSRPPLLIVMILGEAQRPAGRACTLKGWHALSLARRAGGGWPSPTAGIPGRPATGPGKACSPRSRRWLGSLAGARVLDLYAGSGAVGLEALSRGAEHVLLVEHGARAARVIRENIEAIGLPGAVLAADKVERVLARGPGRGPVRRGVRRPAVRAGGRRRVAGPVAARRAGLAGARAPW